MRTEPQVKVVEILTPVCKNKKGKGKGDFIANLGHQGIK